MLKDTKELIIDPDFQRNAVWEIEQERELIESVLMGSHDTLKSNLQPMENRGHRIHGVDVFIIAVPTPL